MWTQELEKPLADDHTVLYYTILHCIILYYTILHYTVPHHTTLHYTIQH